MTTTEDSRFVWGWQDRLVNQHIRQESIHNWAGMRWAVNDIINNSSSTVTYLLFDQSDDSIDKTSEIVCTERFQWMQSNQWLLQRCESIGTVTDIVGSADVVHEVYQQVIPGHLW